MKRIRVHAFGGPEVMKLEEVDDFEPGADEVVIRAKAIGVNPYDTYMRSGSYGPRNPALPYTPGTDLAGVVESIGPGVSHFAPGDRVYTSGTLSGAYAEQVLCRSAQVHFLPQPMSFAQGAAINVPYASAHHALFGLARVQSGETVLIHGASGGVGIAAIQLARAAGLHVIGTAGSDPGLELIERQGAHQGIRHHEPDSLERIRAATGDRGADVVLEMLANANLDHDLDLLAARGRVVVIGCRGRVEIDPRRLMIRDASIQGMLLWNRTDIEMSGIHAALRADIEADIVRPVVGAEFPLGKASEAHNRIMEPGALGKIVLVP
jgi:NADPH2:quinone reductase